MSTWLHQDDWYLIHILRTSKQSVCKYMQFYFNSFESLETRTKILRTGLKPSKITRKGSYSVVDCQRADGRSQTEVSIIIRPRNPSF